MRRTSGDPRLAFAALALCLVLASPALALTFSASCDRFEADGNAFGPPGGALDFVDDFDGGTLAPNWTVLLGSADEAGTNATIHNPGFTVALGSQTLEISTLENDVHGVGQGEGDFTANTYWSSGLPGTNSEFHTQLYSVSPIIEAAGITVNNADVAAPGGSAGYSVTQSLTHGFGSGFTVVQTNSVPIVPALVTGRIVTRMTLDDATDMLTCSFSLDGGATFQSPFPPMHVFNSGVVDYDILVGAAGFASTGPPPPPPSQMLPLQLLSLKNPSNPVGRRVNYKAKSVPHTLNSAAGDPTIGGATLNVQIDSQSQCFLMPPSNWTHSGRTFKYSDSNGVYGPVKSAQIKQGPSGSIENRVAITGRNGAVTIVPPNPGVQGDTNFNVGGGGSYCTTTAGGTIKPNDAHTFKAKNSGTSADCTVPACSASGAFLGEVEN